MLKLSLCLLSLVLVCTACVTRIGIYAPHRSATDDHRRATVNRDCLGCHDLRQQQNHAAADDCLRCHILCRGC